MVEATKERKTQLTADQLATFVAMYTNPDCSMVELEQTFDRKAGTLYRWGYEYGLKRPKVQGEIKLALDMVRNYCIKVSEELPRIKRPPAFGVPAYIGRTSIDYALWLTDLHAGSLTASFNAATFAMRMQVLAERLIHRAKRYDGYFKQGRLNLFSLGDLVTGERVGHMTTFEELEHALLTQVYNIAIPRLVQVTEQLLKHFGTIDVYAVPGNHGIIGKPTVSAMNWDTVVAKGWEAKFTGIEQVTFDVATGWYNFATVKGIDWLLTHGDAARGGNPNALANKVGNWHRSIPEHFDNVACGHFHNYNKIGEVYMGGTLLSDDDWSRKVVGRDGDCCQLLVAISDGGIEDVMPIWLKDVTEADYDG